METGNFGTVLREARERRSVSLAQVAQETKVSVAALKLLEAGKLDDLPPEIFVRGFIRSYAKSVGIHHNEPLTLFDAALAQRKRSEAAALSLPALTVSATSTATLADPASEDDGPAPRRGIGLAVFVIIVLLIATITLSLFLRQQPQSGEALSMGAVPTAASSWLSSMT